MKKLLCIVLILMTVNVYGSMKEKSKEAIEKADDLMTVAKLNIPLRYHFKQEIKEKTEAAGNYYCLAIKAYDNNDYNTAFVEAEKSKKLILKCIEIKDEILERVDIEKRQEMGVQFKKISAELNILKNKDGVMALKGMLFEAKNYLEQKNYEEAQIRITECNKIIVNFKELKYISKKTIRNRVKKQIIKRKYIVAIDDCLWKIANKVYKNPRLWVGIYKANRKKIKNFNLVYPGQVLNIPK